MKSNLAVSTVVWVVSFATIYQLADAPLWLTLILASSVSHGVYLYAQAREHKALFDMADAELVRVSALTNRLEAELSELRSSAESDLSFRLAKRDA